MRLYERDGIQMVHQLNGMFTISILDRRKQALYLIRDRIGVKPLYLHYDGNVLLFASELRPALLWNRASIDYQALGHFLTYVISLSP